MGPKTKPKFHVGDTVYIFRSDTPDNGYERYSDYIGMVATVKVVDTNDNSYKLDADDMHYWWYESEIEAYV